MPGRRAFVTVSRGCCSGTHNRIHAAWSALATLLALVSAGLATAQTMPQMENPLLKLMPELRQAAAPGWVKEGARVTYYGASASIPRERYYVYKNERGNLMKADEVGPAGAGLAQFEVVALDHTTAALSHTLFMGVETGQLAPHESFCEVGVPGATSIWVNPGVLATADRFQGGGLRVVRMPYTVGGKTYNGVRFDYTVGNDHHASVFEQETGLLIYYTHAVESPDLRRVQLAMAQLVNMRQVNLPWGTGTAPDWLQAQGSVAYEGRISVFVPGSPTIPMPYSMAVQVKSNGAKWTRFSVVRYVHGMVNSSTEMVTGAGQIFRGFWLPPQALSVLQPGQVLDQDPDTKMTVSVAAAPAGFDGIVLTESNGAAESVYAYDRSNGALVYIKEVRANVQAELQRRDTGL